MTDENKAEQLKVLASAPPPPAKLKGQRHRPGQHVGLWETYLKERAKWVDKAKAAGCSFEDMSAALKKKGHIVTDVGLAHAYRKVHGSSKKGTSPGTATAKMSKADLKLVAGLMDDLVEQRVAPLRNEVLRLRGIERKYKALQSIISEVNKED